MRTRGTTERLRGGYSLRRGAMSSVFTFTLPLFSRSDYVRAVESSFLHFFGTSVTNLNETPRALATSSIMCVRS